MPTVMLPDSLSALSSDIVGHLSELKREPEWLRERRLAAWRLFETLPMPDWRRTPLDKLDLSAFAPFVQPQVQTLPPGLQALIESGEERAGLLIQHNSSATDHWLDESLAKQGVILVDLDTAVREYPELVEKYLMTEVVQASEGKFEALHGALWSGGALLYVPRNVEIAQPIHIYYYVDQPGSSIFPHTLVVTEPGSVVTVLEESVSPPAFQALACGIIEVYLKPTSQVRFIKLQDWNEQTWDFSTARALAEQDTGIYWSWGTVGSRLSRVYLESLLIGAGATTELLGVHFLNGTQHLDIYTLMNHIAQFTSGDLLFRGALQDQSYSVFEGLIKIHPGAQDTNSYLHDNTLLLSDDARADSIPSLEIEANEVRASHGATVGQVDEEQLFYLMTRGLPRKVAERMIVEGFFAPVIDRIPLPVAQEKLRAAIERKYAARA